MMHGVSKFSLVLLLFLENSAVLACASACHPLLHPVDLSPNLFSCLVLLSGAGTCHVTLLVGLLLALPVWGPVGM